MTCYDGPGAFSSRTFQSQHAERMLFPSAPTSNVAELEAECRNTRATLMRQVRELGKAAARRSVPSSMHDDFDSKFDSWMRRKMKKRRERDVDDSDFGSGIDDDDDDDEHSTSSDE